MYVRSKARSKGGMMVDKRWKLWGYWSTSAVAGRFSEANVVFLACYGPYIPTSHGGIAKVFI